MKKIKIQIIATSLAALTCASFAPVQNREEELKGITSKYVVVNDKCFDALLKNLKDVKAIIFVPESKLEKGTALNLQKVSEKKDSVDMKNYVQVKPVANTTEDCATKSITTFDNLNMIVFVEKSSLSTLSASSVDIKWENIKIGALDMKTHSFIKIGTPLKTTFLDKTTPLLLTQVEYKI